MDWRFGITLWIGLLTIGCQDKPLTLTDSIQAIQTVVDDPSMADSICPKITDITLRDQCWHSTPTPKDKSTAMVRCDKLSTQAKPECYFKLAEQHNDVELCLQAGRFDLDCRTHILQQNCGRFQHGASLVRYTKTLGLDPSAPNVSGLTHRCLLKNKPYVDIRICASMHQSERCRSHALEIFEQKMTKKYVDCSTRTSRMKTFGDVDLMAKEQAIISKFCPTVPPKNSEN